MEIPVLDYLDSLSDTIEKLKIKVSIIDVSLPPVAFDEAVLSLSDFSEIPYLAKNYVFQYSKDNQKFRLFRFSENNKTPKVCFR